MHHHVFFQYPTFRCTLSEHSIRSAQFDDTGSFRFFCRRTRYYGSISKLRATGRISFHSQWYIITSTRYYGQLSANLSVHPPYSRMMTYYMILRFNIISIRSGTSVVFKTDKGIFYADYLRVVRFSTHCWVAFSRFVEQFEAQIFSQAQITFSTFLTPHSTILKKVSERVQRCRGFLHNSVSHPVSPWSLSSIWNVCLFFFSEPLTPAEMNNMSLRVSGATGEAKLKVRIAYLKLVSRTPSNQFIIGTVEYLLLH